MTAEAAVAENPRETIGGNKPPPLREILAENYRLFDREIEDIAAKANEAPKEIKTQLAFASAGDIARDARDLVKRIDKARTTEKEPHLTAGREIDAFFKVFIDRADRIFKTMEERGSVYTRARAAEERRKAEEAQRAANEEAARQRKIAEDEASRGRVNSAAKHEDKAEHAEEQAALAAAQAQTSVADLTRVRTESGIATASTVFSFEITNLAGVDLEAIRPYLPKADIEKAIRAFVRVNKDSLPLAGVRIFPDVKARFR